MLRPLINEARINEDNVNCSANVGCAKGVVQPLRKGHTPPFTNTKSGNKFSYSDFARQLAKQPMSTGAIAPSSQSLARQVVNQADLNDAMTVVELGPGTGVFTEQIIARQSSDALFFAIELNPAFVQATKSRCPSARVYHDAAISLPEQLQKNGRAHADCIVSSLPWTIFDEQEQDEILNTISASLKPGGVFISIIYLGAKIRSRGRYFINNLPAHFSSVDNTPTVWRNLPPTQIYRCVK